MRQLLFLVAFLPFAAQAANHQVYRWLDKQGVVHFSDQPPPADVRNVQQVNYAGGAGTPAQSYAMRQAQSKNPVTYYSTADCGFPCQLAQQLLTRRGIPYAAKDPSKEKAAYEALNKMFGKVNVPVLVVGDRKLNGFQEQAWNDALDQAGYPKESSQSGAQPAATKTAKQTP